MECRGSVFYGFQQATPFRRKLSLGPVRLSNEFPTLSCSQRPERREWGWIAVAFTSLCFVTRVSPASPRSICPLPSQPKTYRCSHPPKEQEDPLPPMGKTRSRGVAEWVQLSSDRWAPGLDDSHSVVSRSAACARIRGIESERSAVRYCVVCDRCSARDRRSIRLGGHEPRLACLVKVHAGRIERSPPAVHARKGKFQFLIIGTVAIGEVVGYIERRLPYAAYRG